MSKCVCEGNWRNIIEDTDHLIGKIYYDSNNVGWRFIGVLWAADDYYYTFRQKSGEKYKFVTCVMSFEQVVQNI